MPNVILIIRERIFNGFTYIDVGRKVHHGVDLMLTERLADLGNVAHVRLHEGHAGWNRGAVTGREVVEDDGLVARGNQLTNTMATDVTSTTDDENLHEDRKLG